MKLNKIIKALFLLMAVCLVSSCATTKHTSDFFAMDTLMHIEAYGDDAEAAIGECEAYINNLSADIDRKGKGCIGELNKNKTATLSDDVLELLQLAIEYGNDSDGALNILLANTSDLWGFYTKEYNVPADAQIQESLADTDLKNIIIDGNRVSIPQNVSIDFGAIAKGYAASKVREILNKHGVKHAMATLGGNVVTIGNSLGDSPWRIGIKKPDSQTEVIGRVNVADKSVVTSGSYERFFEQDGKVYHHILNPKTGYPTDNDIASVTIISSNDTLADALSTAVFVMGKEKALTLYKKRGDFEYIIIDNNGDVTTSKNANLQTR